MARSASVGILLLSVASLVACQPTPDERFKTAETHFANANYQASIAELKNLLRAEPDRGEARLMLARASFILNDLGTAESEYRRALSRAGSDASVRIFYARTLLAQDDVPRALEVAVPSLLELGSSEAIALVGDIHRRSGDLSAAKQYYAQALEMNAESAVAAVGLALTAVGMGDLGAAAERLDAAVQRHPNSMLVLRAKADVLSEARQYDQAVVFYDRALEAESALTPVGEQFLTRCNRVRALMSAGQFDEVDASLDGLWQRIPGHPLIGFFRGSVAFYRDDFDTAESDLLLHLTAAPGDTQSQVMLGTLYFAQGQLRQAEQYLSAGVRAKAGGDVVGLLLAETHRQLARPRAESAGVRYAVSDRAGAGASRWQSLGHEEGDDRSLGMLRRWIAERPDDHGVRRVYAQLLDAYGETEQAVIEYEQLLQRDELDAVGLSNLAWRYLERDRPGAGEIAARAQELQPTSGPIVATWGWMQYRQGQVQQAVATLRRASDLSPNDAEIRYRLAIVLYDTGRKSEARRMLSNLLDSRTGFPSRHDAEVFLGAMR
ncbi:MAG: tetratricopeptide repeat protein [Pseudomonadota bacterium]